MSSVDEHRNTALELISDINEKIRMGLLVNRQKIVGFAASEASTNLFAYFLHKKQLITPGFNVNHKYFVSLKRANDAFKEDFEDKKNLLNLLVKQEFFRDKLCYGKAKEERIVLEAVENLFHLKKAVERILSEVL